MDKNKKRKMEKGRLKKWAFVGQGRKGLVHRILVKTSDLLFVGL